MPGAGNKRKRPDVSLDGDLVALHRARVVEWSPTAITALAATTDGTVVAVARESGSIELWNTEHWQCMKVSGPVVVNERSKLTVRQAQARCAVAAHSWQRELSHLMSGLDV